MLHFEEKLQLYLELLIIQRDRSLLRRPNKFKNYAKDLYNRLLRAFLFRDEVR